MSKPSRDHWEAVHASRAPGTASWHQSDPKPSLALIEFTGVGPDDPIVDVGAGTSLLVDRLLDEGYRRVAALDISAEALAATKERLGQRAGLVEWLQADVTTWSPPEATFALWHDRAVFHFLTDPAERGAYLRALDRGLRPGGWLVLATFSETGPERCSGLPVVRYSQEGLAAVLGPGFARVACKPETHRTPGGAAQDFTWCLFRKRSAVSPAPTPPATGA